MCTRTWGNYSLCFYMLQIKLNIFTVLSQERVSTRELASVIGSLVATFPATTYGKLCYRKLEILISLKSSKGNFEHKIYLTSVSHIELNWLNNLDFHKRIITPEVDLTIYADASNFGWGAADGHNPT